MSSTNINYSSFSDAERQERLKRAEDELLNMHVRYRHHNDTRLSNVDLLEGDTDYHFLYNFIPETQLANTNLNINFESDNLNQVFEQSQAQTLATKDYYLEKAAQLKDYWEHVLPTREAYGDLRDVYHNQSFRLQQIVELLNTKLEFTDNVLNNPETANLSADQKGLLKDSLSSIHQHSVEAQQAYLSDDFWDIRIPFFASDMSPAEAKMQKEMFLIENVVLNGLDDNFYNAYDSVFDSHIDYQVLSKQADDAGEAELSRLYGYISQTALDIKMDFIDVFRDKYENGTITQESLQESISFALNNLTALQERLAPDMIAAVESGKTFDQLSEETSGNVTTGFSSLREEFDAIKAGLFEHAEGKKTIQDIMREKANKVIDFSGDDAVDSFEIANTIVRSRHAKLEYNSNYDMNNDGVVNLTDIIALNDVLSEKNPQFNSFDQAFHTFDANNDGKISADEAETLLSGYRNARANGDMSYDFNANGNIDHTDYRVLLDTIKASMGVDFTGDDGVESITENILNFTQNHADRRLELFNIANNKLEEYYESAGETYGTRRKFYHRYQVAKQGLHHQNVGGSYIDHMLGGIAHNKDWMQDETSDRVIAFNERLNQLDEALDGSLETFQTATEIPENPNNWGGGFDSWRESIEARVISATNIHKARAGVYGTFFKDADAETLAQNDAIFDLLEVAYMDYFNFRWGSNLQGEENNQFHNVIDQNPDGERNIDVSDVAVTVVRSMWKLAYHSRYRAHDLDQKHDNLYNETFDAYVEDFVALKQALQDGVDINSREFEEMQDSMQTKYDLMFSLGLKDEATIKAANLVDVDGDGVVTANERANAFNGFLSAQNLSQTLTANDIGVSELSEQAIAEFDLNNDGFLNELDYDILDNAAGYNAELPLNDVLSGISKNQDVLDYLNGIIDLEAEEDQTATIAQRDFLAAEVDFDQEISDNFWRIAVDDNIDFKSAYNNLEDLRLQVLEAIENGEDTTDLIAQLNESKEAFLATTRANQHAIDDAAFAKELDILDEGRGKLAHRYLTDKEFFTPTVMTALDYIETQDNKLELIDQLLENPAAFGLFRKYLDAAEKLGITISLEHVMNGGFTEDQLELLDSVIAHTDHVNFVEDPEQNRLMLLKLGDHFFDQGDLDFSALTEENERYVDLMIKYIGDYNSENIHEDATVVIQDMIAHLFDPDTISDSNTAGGRRGYGTRGGVGNRSRGSGTSRYGSGGIDVEPAEPTFYDKVKEFLNRAEIKSLSDLEARDRLISELNLASGNSPENIAVINAVLEVQVQSNESLIADLRAQADALANGSRYNNVYAIRGLYSQISSLQSQIDQINNFRNNL